MGPERLTALRGPRAILALAVLAGLGCASCQTTPDRAVVSGATSVSPKRRHVQIVHAMKTPERRALVEALKARNAPQTWAVNDDALAQSLLVVDPFAGFLRRARRTDPGATRGEAITEERAGAGARAFVKRNADLLGLPHHVVPALAEHVRPIEPGDHGGPRARWMVRLEAPFPSKGYESFHELDNVADLELVVADDGEPSSFVNVSRIHPRLLLDPRPSLAEEDPRVIQHVRERTVFALLDAATGEGELPRDLRTLPRLLLGKVESADVTRRQIVIHVSPGPQLAWLTYRLGWLVEAAKTPGPDFPGYYFFRWVVDADTGDVVEEATAPIGLPSETPPP